MTLEITFPHPDRAISPNGQVTLTERGAVICNRKRVALKGATRQAAFTEAMKAMQFMPQRNFPARSFEVEWRYKGMIPDVDNVVARMKPLLDGCCQAFGIDDRYLELGRVKRVHTLGADAGTVILSFSTEP